MLKVCYLRVLPAYDNKRNYFADGKVCHLKREVFKNELLTLKQAYNINVPMSWLQAVKVERCSVYYFFGIRRCKDYQD